MPMRPNSSIPPLRPPRQSPATAYLQHLARKRIECGGTKQGGVRVLRNRTQSVSTCSESLSSCHSNSSIGNVSQTLSSGSSNSSSSRGGGYEEQVVPVTQGSTPIDTTTALVTYQPPSPHSEFHLSEDDEDVADDIGDDSLQELEFERLILGDIVNEFGLQDNDDDDSLVLLDRLLAETSHRWKESATTVSSPSVWSRKSAQQVIDQQAVEIEALRAQLQWQQQQRQSQQQQYQPEEEVDILPVEEIEVIQTTHEDYDDAGDHLSVTSGLTHMYELQRPDSESVTGIQSLHMMSHNHHHKNNDDYVNDKLKVHLTAQDGTTRQALYRGPLWKGLPHGVGVLEFVETGDLYVGDLCKGAMHGSGTYTTAKHKVLKGRFEHNVFVR